MPPTYSQNDRTPRMGPGEPGPDPDDTIRTPLRLTSPGLQGFRGLLVKFQPGEDAMAHVSIQSRYLAPLMLFLLAVSGAARAGDAITLDVDLRESARQLFHGHEVIPVKPGPLTLYYPKWIPGEHSP